MAGTIPLSMTQQLDEFGTPLKGGKLYIIQAGTVSTPQIAYQDSALTIPVSGGSTITLDASGRLPQFFLADGSIKIRLTDVNGVEKLVADGILVVGASSGGGGGSPVDATTVLATGDIKVRYGTGVLTGFVRCNARTLGSATSGGSERANADAQALFEYLWNTDANLTVSSGRGATSIADWSANKTIALPDWRGRALAALDDMGNSAAGRLTATYFGTASTVLGAAGGAESTSAIITHTHDVFLNDPGHTHLATHTTVINQGGGGGVNAGDTNSNVNTTSSSTTGITVRDAAGGAGNANKVAAPAGAVSAHNIVSPTMLATVYLKL